MARQADELVWSAKKPGHAYLVLDIAEVGLVLQEARLRSKDARLAWAHEPVLDKQQGRDTASRRMVADGRDQLVIWNVSSGEEIRPNM